MLSELRNALRPALVLLLLFAVLLGLIYPMAVLGIGQAAFPSQANGSLIEDGGRVIGSDLIGQAFTRPEYFHGRPSAAGAGDDAAASSGSNLGPTSQALKDRVAADVARARADGLAGPVPADLVTASASGLDPHLSPAAALAQAARVATARGLPEAEIRALVGKVTERPLLGFIGEERVNVLRLNRQLDAMATRIGS
ncbi:MAG: potassium-transporting ATPase subunit KdpC [Sphingomonadales bacterium]